MSKFISLLSVLEGHFDKKLDELPDHLRERVQRHFQPILRWETIPPDMRRHIAIRWDFQHDPIGKSIQQPWWGFYVRKGELEKEFGELSSIRTSTDDEFEEKEARLDMLRHKLDTLEHEEFQVLVGRPDHEHSKTTISPISTVSKYIRYTKAFNLLSKRLNAFPEEIAAWVWESCYKDRIGLAAYLKANESETPPRFLFSYCVGEDYLAPLMTCWFLADDVFNFKPVNRYIIGKDLIKRWSEQPGIQPEAFIQAMIAELRLRGIHPIYSVTQGSPPDDKFHPLLETSLFLISQIEEIEASEFASDETESPIHTKPPGHLDYDPEMQERANEIAAEIKTNTKRVPTKGTVAKKLATELGKSVEIVLRRTRVKWKPPAPPKFKKPPK